MYINVNKCYDYIINIIYHSIYHNDLLEDKNLTCTFKWKINNRKTS